MKKYDDATLDAIRAKLPVSAIVGRKVALQKLGREFRGLSPFKPEKSPSFFVNDAKGFYHCFGSGEHGDIFSFLMKTEGLSFDQAVERLAVEAGVPLPFDEPFGSARQPKYRYSISNKLPLLLKRLRIEYVNQGRGDLIEILDHAGFEIAEHSDETYHEGKTYIGHDITLLVPLDIIGKTPLASQDQVGERIRADLALAAKSVTGEFINRVALEAVDGAPTPAIPSTRATQNDPADWHASFWEENLFRVFVSHRDTHKTLAHELAEALRLYGICAFVAHDTIEPDSEWQIEIEKGLQTMEVMLALITDDFYESVWTQQEIGFALGRQTPVICVKAGSKDPQGFVQKKQAAKIDLTDTKIAARLIAPLIAKHVGIARFRDVLIAQLVEASSFIDADRAFSALNLVDGYTAEHAAAIIKGFKENSQLNRCYMLRKPDRLLRFLTDITGKEYTIHDNEILETIPF